MAATTGLTVLIRTNVSPSFWGLVSIAALVLAGTADWLARGTLSAFYGLPLAAAAFAAGWRGGVAAAVVSSVLVLAVPGDTTMSIRTSNAAALLCLGALLGFSVELQRRQRGELQKKAEQLSSVYGKVQANFEGMKRVERLSAMGQLSAGLAHEIRNPLAGISGAAAILRRNENLNPKHARCVSIIESECQRLDGLLTNFLNFARPRQPRLQPVQLEPVLDNVVELASHGVRAELVQCELSVDSGLPPVECDPEQLEQVLLNLMINAVEASPDGETVRLSAATEDGKVAIRVVDRGHGVAPAHLDRLFDPFFTTKEHGTGLGLPVAHQIMIQMGGMLVAERNQDRGMTFSVILPAKQSTT